MKNQIDNDPPDFIVSPYQKMICRMTNTIATTTPQNTGLWNMETFSSCGIGVRP